MNLKDFINHFDLENLENPDWSLAPKEWPHCRDSGLSTKEISKLNAIKAVWEISRPKSAASKSRVWQDPEGFGI